MSTIPPENPPTPMPPTLKDATIYVLVAGARFLDSLAPILRLVTAEWFQSRVMAAGMPGTVAPTNASAPKSSVTAPSGPIPGNPAPAGR